MTATVGAYGGPDAPGTAYVLLHLTMGDPGDGHVGGWGFVRGGMGGLANACRRAAEAAGAEVRTGAGGRPASLARGARPPASSLDNGDELRAPVVVSSAHPKLTFLELVGPGAAAARLRRRPSQRFPLPRRLDQDQPSAR